MIRVVSRDSRSSRRQSRISSSSGGGMFDLDENASSFEKNMCMLGGLLSAHKLITHAQEKRIIKGLKL